MLTVGLRCGHPQISTRCVNVCAQLCLHAARRCTVCSSSLYCVATQSWSTHSLNITQTIVNNRSKIVTTLFVAATKTCRGVKTHQFSESVKQSHRYYFYQGVDTPLICTFNALPSLYRDLMMLMSHVMPETSQIIQCS